eukprot:15366007-Ditylum_brightwellii.AAC.1
MITVNTVSTLPANDDPLSFFASKKDLDSTQDKIQQYEPKQPQHIECCWENDNAAYYDAAYDYDADKLQKHRMEDDIAKLKLQLAEEKAEQDRLHLFGRCIERENSLLRQDLQNAAGDQHADTWVQDAKGVKGTIQRCVMRVLEEQNMLQNDMSIMEKEINALKQKIQSFGVDPADIDNETLATDDTSVSTDYDDDSLPDICTSHSFPKEIRTRKLTNIFSFRRCGAGNASSLFMGGRGQREECQGLRKTEGGELVAESLLWD